MADENESGRGMPMNSAIDGKRALSPLKAEEVLKAYQIDTARGRLCDRGLDQIMESAREIGFPLVLKAVSSTVLHKSDAGLVRLGIANEQELVHVYEDLRKEALKVMPEAALEGFLVQEMIRGGHEVIVGLADDPTFGKVILFGLGGIFVEILKDIAIRKIPITPADAGDMIEQIRGLPILKGARGREPADLDLLRRTLLKVSRLGQEREEIAEMDLNPVFIDRSRAVAVDPRIILSERSAAGRVEAY